VNVVCSQNAQTRRNKVVKGRIAENNSKMVPIDRGLTVEMEASMKTQNGPGIGPFIISWDVI
jgi:hypothetical protein